MSSENLEAKMSPFNLIIRGRIESLGDAFE